MGLLLNHSPRVEHWIAVALFTLQLVWGYAFTSVTPPFEGPDEGLHYHHIVLIVQNKGLPSPEAVPIRHPPLYYVLSAFLIADLPVSDYQAPANPFAVYDNSTPAFDNRNITAFTQADLQAGDVLALKRVRLLSVLFGATAVVFVFFSARLVFRDDNLLSMAVAILVSSFPPFSWITSMVNNDSLAILMGSVLTWASLRGVNLGTSRKGALLLGILAGLGMMTKFSLWLFMPALLVLILLNSLRTGLKGIIMSSSLFIGGLLSVSAWWFVRNGLLMPQLAGPEQLRWLGPIRWQARPPSSTLLSVALNQLTGVWDRYGYQVELPAYAEWVGIALVLIAVAGLLVRVRRDGLRMDWRKPAFWVAIIAILNLSSGLYAVWISRDGGQGRFLYPAGVTSFAILLVLGWSQLQPLHPRQPHVLNIVGAIASLSFLSFMCIYRPAYAPPRLYRPEQLPSGMEPINASFGDVAVLLGASVRPIRAAPGDSVVVTACWQPLRQEQDAQIVEQVEILDNDLSVVASRFTLPGLGRYSSADWRPGQVFCDEISVRIPPQAAAQNQYRVAIQLAGLRAERDGKTLDPLIVGSFSIPPRITSLPRQAIPCEARSGDIALLGYTVTRPPSSPSTVQVGLYWRALVTPSASYHVFVHLLDSSGDLITQSDGIPGNGRYPTSLWGNGEIIEDRHDLTVSDAAALRTGQLLVGMYEYPSGQRLPATGEQTQDNAIRLSPLGQAPS
ncbi:MAG TPA: glycosyltransferase family 39 protein [Anaerolineae bacterium]|nr:glycosyltransferase family 39 protein [Anaerolineae bacterium]